MKEAFKGQQCDELSDLLIIHQLISTLSQRSLGFLINFQITTKRLHSAPGPCDSQSRFGAVSSFSLLSAFMKLSSPFTRAPHRKRSLSALVCACMVSERAELPHCGLCQLRTLCFRRAKVRLYNHLR